MAMLAASAVIASACSHTEPKPVVRIVEVKATIPDSARQKCAQPVALPDRDMTSGEVTVKWGADRAALLTCETRRAAAVAAVDAAGEDR
ncbi:conserved protein of unknown function [Shinella sp. WSC3-e]|nr:conserved hypothetical protein [Rhizobiaceae bacterium]CAK7257535.1 conserved protein of unknown function [Shinella sp. WSC3-e]